MKKVIRYFLVSLFGLMLSSLGQARTVVVIDAGHGGKDPGAIGKTLGIKEKEVTLSISKELKTLLDADPNFKAVMTRSSDVFIQLPERTEIARKNRANYLVSIHADSSPVSSEVKGASVWVLSNQRASDEMGKWLEESEKQSELLGGAGRILSNNNERYLNQTVLDLQFSHSQRAGYELGKTVLARMANMTTLAKSVPQHASLSVLRSPDITSILVETGFLSNPIEEKKLATASYRKQLAKAIYNGLVAYRNSHVNISESRISNVKVKEVKESKKDKDKKEDTSKDEPKKPVKEASVKEKKSTKAENAKDIERKSKEKTEVKKEEKSERKQPQKSNTGYHLVQQDETLYSIARVYGTTPEKLSQLNNIKNNQIVVGKKLKVQ
ncbi:N-acetylmuramoyl-L-alanine amidase [uncultured Actinobacillus sp.]|uniref:N-acetylmuramoyl-L-alanine amidase n=1 Tax=uncultured Actinobacillus sp. TaxID=417616 RepID=UPI0025ECA23F|nr:N-acetylmuramoyl-L-alanine amidase [uncultured Actinobacillus sp.]